MLVILGESGSGKSTLLNRLTEPGARYSKVVTYTTRPMRPYELDHIDYHFISDAEFDMLKERNFFVEHMDYRGWQYGTAIEDCAGDEKAIVMTPRGLRALRSCNIPTKSIYLKVDRRSRIKKMLDRGDEIDEVWRRDLTDVGRFDGIESEVDFVIQNPEYCLTPDELKYQVMKLLTPPATNIMPGQLNCFASMER